MYRHTVAFPTVGALRERERELEMLSDGLGRARGGEGTLLLMEGPPGVGKTELGREARMVAERAGMTVLAATGSELEQPFAFGVVRQLLEPKLGDAPARAELFGGGAGPAARLFEPHERPPAVGDAAFEALHSLYWLVVNLSDRAPLAIVVDDCQWADEGSLRFLAYLAQRIEGLPVAMILAGRPPDSPESEAGSVWSQIASRPAAIALYPRSLSASAAAMLVRERLGDEADDEFCLACHTATGGNPLFLQELLRALEAAETVPSAATAGDIEAVGPAAVSRFVLHRLAALGPGTADLARAVAVLGDDSEPELAARVSGLGDAAARVAADDLVRADIFARGERLGFVHPIVRAALYEDLAPGERQARHAAVAAQLARLGAPAERVTAHLLLTPATGDQARIEILRSAATGAAHRGAPRTAAERLHRALAESPGEQQRAEILSELGRYEIAAMQFAQAEEHLRECMASKATLSIRADAAATLGRCAIVSGGRSAESAADALGSLAEEVRPIDIERSLELGSALLMVATVVPRLRTQLGARLERFSEQARGHAGYEAVAKIHSAQERLWQGGSAARAVEEVQAALAAGIPSGAQTSAAILALLTLRQGERFDVALRMLDLALERARQEGHAARQGIIHGERAAIALALAQGSLHDALVEAETGLVLVEEPHFVVPQLLGVAITVHVERGELAEASALARRGDVFRAAETQTHLGEYVLACARLQMAMGHTREAVTDLLWLGGRLEELGLLWPGEWRVYAVAVLASLDEGECARDLARRQLAIARQAGAAGTLGMSLRAAALAASDEAERLRLLDQAVSVLERGPTRLELAHALADLGTGLTRAGRRREARDAARRAQKLARDCGALALADRALAALHAGPGRRARVELTGRDALTAAEWRVCHQAADGRANREIAEALFVTEKTVERHLSSAYQKLGIRSRFQLAGAIAD
jgi:DNA-binding CsgD family transcriptional regulator